MYARSRHQWTEEEYLALERGSDIKHEYYDGDIYAFAGGSLRHVLITTNTARALGNRMAGSPCLVLQSDLKVKMLRSYFYPDVTVVCGAPQTADDYSDVLINPTVVIEVLSPSTEKFDRGAKLLRYQTIETLQEYVLIEQDKPFVEQYTRHNQWQVTDYEGLTAIITLPSLAVSLPLSELYTNVIFHSAL